MKNEQYHIKCTEGDVGRFVILTGDPGRCADLANYLDSPHHVSTNREYTVYTGTLCGEKVSVASTGIGGPSASIAIEELAAIGADTFIRVGTCGGINQKVKSGDCVIAMSAVRQEGTSHEYAPSEYPATADFDVVSALADSAKEMGYSHHVGVIQSKDSFYGQHSPHRMPISDRLIAKWESWKRLGVLASEMECAALFTAAATINVRCGAVLHVIWNQERKASGFEEEDIFDMTKTVRTAIEAMKRLISGDK